MATCSPVGHILTGLASSCVSSTTNMPPPQLLVLLPLLLCCVSPGHCPYKQHLLNTKKTPPESLQNVTASLQCGKPALLPKNTTGGSLLAFFTVKQIVKEMEYNDFDEENTNYLLLQ